MPKARMCHHPRCHQLALMPYHFCKQHQSEEATWEANRSRWTNGHDKQDRYQRYNQYRNHDPKQKQFYNFYSSKQWLQLASIVRSKQHYICQYCKALGINTINQKTVDHIVPRKVNRAKQLDEYNLAVICRRCHAMKTKWEQDYYGLTNQDMAKPVKEVTDVNEIALRMRGTDVGALKKHRNNNI
ncbi:HNH endonuclease [Fructilactobacillus hinvesii]|uniref:HNH endonuclease n=1 Tax=Fructilactobacillus hinvesii TaxID=2940300 RepID=A0ABY5BQU0_9LACO|nr:HNH endonuclease [Fructilactobacillus hinvesii]USS87475.1 HNH endonuclease [Fructilactobacillus hinvesii]